MAYEKRFRVLGPYPKDVDRQVMSWLARESAETKLAGDGLEVVEYSEREVPVEEVPPKSLKQMLELGLAAEDFVWFEYSGLGRVNQPVLDWLTAECVWRNDQIRRWLGAERVWKAQVAHAQ